MSSMKSTPQKGLSNLEYHVLLAMATEPLHGYAVKSAIEAESEGALNPGAGSLYRVFGRLMTRSLIDEVAAPNDEQHPGLARKYYGLTALGEQTLASEARRLGAVAALAAKRLGITE